MSSNSPKSPTINSLEQTRIVHNTPEKTTEGCIIENEKLRKDNQIKNILIEIKIPVKAFNCLNFFLESFSYTSKL